MPRRIQRKRTKNWRMPPNTVSVTRPGMWGNPYRIGKDPNIDTAEDAVKAFRWMIERGAGWDYPGIPAIRTILRGKNLACWCAVWTEEGLRVPCHADILLELANENYKTPARKEDL